MHKGSFLGIDTSNYTTSAALLQAGKIAQSKKLLPVKPGELGLRQSDALFHHTKQLFQVLTPFLKEKVVGIGVSATPRNVPGSYMPCFLAGVTVAQILAETHGVPVHYFSHQEGHIAAALYSAQRLDLLSHRFLAFHLSGGTSEGLLVEPGEGGRPCIRIVAETLDLNAGQAVDRVGLALGLAFPAGKALDQLAKTSTQNFPIKPALKGTNFALSGVENQCKALLAQGVPKADIAAHCLRYIIQTMEKVTQRLVLDYGKLPILFSGGVASNSLMQQQLGQKFGAYFAAPEFSADNAAGVAILAAIFGDTP